MEKEKINYKSVVIKLVPTLEQKKILDRNLLKVGKFLEISKKELQKLIWKKAREDSEIKEAHSRLADLLSQRFTNTVMSNLLYPLDCRNYKVIKSNGWYKVAIRFNPKKEVCIPISRPDCKYYGEIIENTSYPAFIFKEGANYFLSMSIPLKKRWDKNRISIYVGIDLNQRKHVASFYNPLTSRYEKNIFFDLRPIDKKIKELQRKINLIQKGRRSEELSDSEKEKIKSLYEGIKKVIQKGHGDFISKLIKEADKYWEKGFNVVFVLEDLKGITKRVTKRDPSFNGWLHSKWCYHKFAIMLETKAYPVVYINPKNTSIKCHKCGSKVKIYGKHNRLIECSTCGYKDFNRDLNAARNIARMYKGDNHGMVRLR